MNNTLSRIQQSLSRALNAMPGVFSTAQWGGRAYKLPGPGSRGRKKPLLLAHVWIEDGGRSIGIAFKLQRQRAKAIVKQHNWIAPHSFRTLAPSGWLVAEIRTTRQCRTMIELLRESRTLHADAEPSRALRSESARNRKRARGIAHDPVAQRLESVLRSKRAEGWQPAQEDAFT